MLSGTPFNKSDNDYDWLGPGVYFWQSNPKRAQQFALEKRTADLDEPSVDTLLGVFIEGKPIYETSNFFEKTHIQICVCNLLQIKGVYRVRPDEATL